ncbi:MAG TPA: NADPH-dependent F420 reductase [Woeseiaceae bacterium]|nr:NADPH-dependent F420 reductase [Woeseiaceae bacterium]
MSYRVVVAVLALMLGAPAFADTIAVIGTGDVGGALGPEFAAQGHTIVYGSREPERSEVKKLVEKTGDLASATTPADAAAQADIVVLAVPGLLVEEITRSLGDLSGKIIIDPTNPLERRMNRLEHAVDTSNAEIIQAAAPGAYVVKAFNTLNWRTMVDPSSAGGPVSIPLVGDNSRAKKKVAELVSGMGLEPIDVGPLRDARWVEGMLILWINNRYGSMRPSFDYHLRKN